MVRLDYTFSGDAFADGSGNDKFLIDLSEGLSSLYSRQIRQGQIFTVKAVDMRLKNPGTVGQDEMMACSGSMLYYAPTSFRKKAWAVARQVWYSRLKELGIQSSKGADFRVGFSTGYSTDVGIFGEGVKFNAWLNADDDPLMFTGGSNPTEQSIFKNYNDNQTTESYPVNPDGGFGHWAQKDVDALTDQLDFITNENPIYLRGHASETAQNIPFAASFSNVIASTIGVSGDVADTQMFQHHGEFDTMCGLIGLSVDTTLVDDTAAQTQEWTLCVSVEVDSWRPMTRRKSRKSRRSKR